MRKYCPKEKTYYSRMDNDNYLKDQHCHWYQHSGHATFYEELFVAMKFKTTQVTFSPGLRQIMWRKKEYGRIYFGLQKLKRRHHINQRIEGMEKMEQDTKEG